MYRLVAIILGCVAAVQPVAAEPSNQSASAMIEAMRGEWSGVMLAEVPPDAEEFPWRVSCASIALGAGVLCTSEGRATIGAIVQSCLIALDPLADAEVRLMCVSSMGEVHDHRGRYDRGVIRFQPLRAHISGALVEEIVEYQIAPNGEMQTLSIVRAAGRPEMRFTLHAAKLESPAAR